LLLVVGVVLYFA